MHGSRIVPGFTRRRHLAQYALTMPVVTSLRVGQWVTQEGIEDECFAVSPALAWATSSRYRLTTSAMVIPRGPLCAVGMP
jgi:hypothetical protein